jgi:hypothetical protein
VGAPGGHLDEARANAGIETVKDLLKSQCEEMAP